MQPTSKSPASPIPVPEIDTDEPVAVIPVASVAPLDGPPDGERINTFAIASRMTASPFADLQGEARVRIRANPFTYLIGAFSLGVLLARALR